MHLKDGTGEPCVQKLWIPCPAPNLNDLLRQARHSPFTFARTKKQWVRLVGDCARLQGFRRVSRPAHFDIQLREKNRRRDPDNIGSGGLKVVLDGLQDAELIDGDGWSHVLSISLSWVVNKKSPGVMVTVTEEA